VLRATQVGNQFNLI